MNARTATPHRRGIRTTAVGLLAVVLGGCSGGPPSVTPPAPGPTSPSSSAAASIWDSPSVDGSFPIGPERVALAIRCWGSGSPVIVMEGGSGEGGLHRWEGNQVTEALASQTMVCAYDRAGVGESGPAPERRRRLDDVIGRRLPIPAIPVTVVTGSQGQSADDPASQKVWLRGAEPGKQVILETGHDVDAQDPSGLSDAIEQVLVLARG
jgi:hypothetical protein